MRADQLLAMLSGSTAIFSNHQKRNEIVMRVEVNSVVFHRFSDGVLVDILAVSRGSLQSVAAFVAFGFEDVNGFDWLSEWFDIKRNFTLGVSTDDLLAASLVRTFGKVQNWRAARVALNTIDYMVSDDENSWDGLKVARVTTLLDMSADDVRGRLETHTKNLPLDADRRGKNPPSLLAAGVPY